jgi:transaldolase
MFAQGQEMFSWIPERLYQVSLHCARPTRRGTSVLRGIRVNMTLCFSQSQAAVYAATRNTARPQSLSLDQPWDTYDIQHELTQKGLEKFAKDYHDTIASTD